MANSINTNYGAAIALQNLNATNDQLARTQNRVNTGLKVATAKDNGAIYAIATTQRANMGAMDAVKNSLQRGQSIVDVALAAGDTVTAALEEMKQLAVNIQSSVAGSDAETAYLADFNALGKEIDAALKGASFDGVNLWNTTTATNVTTNLSGGSYQIGFGTTDKAAAAAVTAVSAGTAARAGATTTIVDAAPLCVPLTCPRLADRSPVMSPIAASGAVISMCTIGSSTIGRAARMAAAKALRAAVTKAISLLSTLWCLPS